MKTLNIRMFCLFAALVWSAGCGGSGSNQGTGDVADSVDVGTDIAEDVPVDLGPDAFAGVQVDTKVKDEAITLGESTEVECVVTRDGETIKIPAKVVVTNGDDESEMEPGDWSPDKAAEYSVACFLEGTDIIDESPDTLTVNLGSIVKMVTKVVPGEIPAGATASATCEAEDGAGNKQMVTPGLTVTPSDGVDVSGQDIKGKVPGVYDVACKAEDGVEVVHDDLTVVEGKPENFVADVDPSSVGVGESAQVGCTITDAAGNVLDVDWVVEAPAELTVSNKQVTTTKAGKYEINCAPMTKNGNEKYTPAELIVAPGDVVAMKVYYKPIKDHFKIGDNITIFHDLVDQYDNVVSVADIEPIVVVPAEGVELQASKIDKFFFRDDGTYTFKVKALNYPLSGEVTAMCDGYGPVITFTYPPRALTTSDSTSLVVLGNVADSLVEVAELTINDQVVVPDPMGNFSFPMSLVHGMNMISARATDTWGNESSSFRSVFYSTRFIPADPADPAAATIPKALRVFLSQEFIDDGDHSMPADDLATVVEVVLKDFDIASLLPEEGIPFMETLTSSCSAQIVSITYDKPNVTLESVDLGIHVIIEIPNLFGELNVECCYEVPYIGQYCDPYYGFITAEAIVLDVYLFVYLDDAGEVTAELGPLDVDLVGVNLDIQGLTGGMFDTLINLLIGTFTDTAIQAFQEQFAEQLPQLVSDALSQLTEGIALDLPPLIGSGPPTPLTVGLKFSELLFSWDGLYLEIDGSVVAPKAVEHSPLGVLLREGCAGAEPQSFVLPRTSEVNAGIAADLANEALYSLWYGGALQLNLSAEDLASLDLGTYGITNLEISTDLYYAPFIQTCGTDGKLVIQLGDAFVHAKFNMMGMFWDIEMFLFLVIDAEPSFKEVDGVSGLYITLGDFQIAEIDIVNVGDDIKGKEGMVQSLLTDTLLGELKKSLGDIGPIEIPSIDMSSLSPSIPPGTEISVDLQTLNLDKGFVVIGGKLK